MSNNPFPLSRAELLQAYRTMRTIRDFEERLHVEFAKGDIPGFVHLYAGEEACAAGIMTHLTDVDRIASTHRGHGHCIAKGVDVAEMMAEIYGKATGACRGKGGSMHIADLSKGMMGANGILGAGAPLICGAALAAKFRGNGDVGITFFGDGASNQGTVLESMNLAAVWNLPVIFVVENNGYAESTSVDYATAVDSYVDRASGFGLPGVTRERHRFLRRARGGRRDHPAGPRRRRPGAAGMQDDPLLRPFRGRCPDLQGQGRERAQPREPRLPSRLFARRVTQAGVLAAADLALIDREVWRP